MYKTGVKRQIFFFPLQNCAAISVKFDRTESINFINQSTFKKKMEKNGILTTTLTSISMARSLSVLRRMLYLKGIPNLYIVVV